MNHKLRPIYVVEALSDKGKDATEAWQVAVWHQHPALLPYGLVRHVVSTEAGDVELHMPSRDRMCVM